MDGPLLVHQINQPILKLRIIKKDSWKIVSLFSKHGKLAFFDNITVFFCLVWFSKRICLKTNSKFRWIGSGFVDSGLGVWSDEEERNSRKVFLFQVNFPTTQIAIDRLLLFYAVIKDGRYAQYKLTIYCKKGGKHFVFSF